MTSLPNANGPMLDEAQAVDKYIWRSPYAKQIWIVWFLLLGLGLIGMYQRVTMGHMPAGYGSYVPWGLWIAIYFHGVGIAGGAFVVGAMGYILGARGLGTASMLRTVIVLSIAAMVPSFMAVWLDLGRLDRAHRIMTSPNFTSMMAFNSWMYMAFIGVAVVTWVLSFRPRSTWLKPFLVLGIFLACLIPSQSGAFFGVVDARPFWHSALFPVLFLASAITSGAAMLMFVRAALGPQAFRWASMDSQAEHDEALNRLRIVVACGLSIYLVLEFAEFSIAIWSPASHSPAIEMILWGPYWWAFWIVHLLIGAIVPLVLFFFTHRRGIWAVGALLVAITMLTTRLNVLIPGQSVPELKGLQEAFHHPRLNYTYHATAMEYLVGLFLIALGMATYVIARRIGATIAVRLDKETNGNKKK
ncbi:MAG: NrfD/PsrC family molybdoenzyme membrane anchor subunit [Phycisphaeraceae bacterium]